MADKVNPGELESVDAGQCQSEIRSGSFMTLGPRKFVRCGEVPVWICVNVEEGEFCGAMSLCDNCKRVCEIQLPGVKFQRLVVSERRASRQMLWRMPLTT